ncbi:MAG: homoserine kinase [Flavobacteriales bacterium]|nr:homoserine kinase [Flavobacteriales bacterium]
MKSIKVISPSSVANLSCGYDILGVCLDYVGDEMIITKTNSPGLSITNIEGAKLSSSVDKNVAGIAAKSYLSKNPSKFGFEIEIIKKVAAGSGLGSSASSAVAAVYGIDYLLERNSKKINLIKYAVDGEKYASGEAHADNIAPTMLGGLTLVRDLKILDILNLPFPKDLFVTIFYPAIELKTSISRDVLNKKISIKKVVKQTENLGGLISGLYSNDYQLISRCLVDEIVEERRASLIPEFYSLKESAIQNGALGCGISGSGPSIFSISKGKKIALRVKDGFDKVYSQKNIPFKTFISKINYEGVKVLEQ